MMVDLETTIKEILYGYVSCKSITDTPLEKTAEKYFLDYFGCQTYFQCNKELYGAYKIPGDKHKRSVVWAMVKGNGNGTVVLIHHNDVVDVEDFKLLKGYAFSPDQLHEQLKKIKEALGPEAKTDLESGKYLFGRGVCDMKGGGAIQMALLTAYSRKEKFTGNVIVLGLPDEENLSAGMRAAVQLLADLKKRYALDYRLMINSEPHQRRTPEEGVFSFGSIGKVMPYVYVRGSLTHAGKVFEGLNPTNIAAEIVRRTEMNMALSDVVGEEAAPPPTWLYFRENKQAYDVSTPLTVTGCLSVLTLNQTPDMVMKKIRRICEEAFTCVLSDMNRNYACFLKARGQREEKLPWKVKVVDFAQLYQEALQNHGEEFLRAYDHKMADIQVQLSCGACSLIMANFDLVNFVYDYIDDLSPRVVIGLMPPYYPNVANVIRYEGENEKIKNLYDMLNHFTRQTYGQNYIRENYYTGISDLSYSGIFDGQVLKESLEKNMPFFGKIYNLPIEAVEEISMPCVNIGPWGKDFHKLTERVLKEDLYRRTPNILNYVIVEMLKN